MGYNVELECAHNPKIICLKSSQNAPVLGVLSPTFSTPLERWIVGYSSDKHGSHDNRRFESYPRYVLRRFDSWSNRSGVGLPAVKGRDYPTETPDTKVWDAACEDGVNAASTSSSGSFRALRQRLAGWFRNLIGLLANA